MAICMVNAWAFGSCLGNVQVCPVCLPAGLDSPPTSMHSSTHVVLLVRCNRSIFSNTMHPFDRAQADAWP